MFWLDSCFSDAVDKNRCFRCAMMIVPFNRAWDGPGNYFLEKGLLQMIDNY